MDAHIPVLLHEAVELLAIKPNGTYADLTFGRGGHSREIAKRLTGGRLICVDKDNTAIENGKSSMAGFGEKVILIKSDFRELEQRFTELQIGGLDGVLMDLGVSSPQLDDAARGFSYMAEAPLDMRMDSQSGLSAYEIVNEWSEGELVRILREYGEERYAGLIAARITQARLQQPIKSTTQLVDIIRKALPAKALREKQHPAKRSFQALRIAVNDELAALSDGLEAAERLLKPGGRIVVITFHSLEDRIVKNFFADKAKGCICPPSFPVCVCGINPTLTIITKKPVVPGDDELMNNPRARSAKLRAAEKPDKPSSK